MENAEAAPSSEVVKVTELVAVTDEDSNPEPVMVIEAVSSAVDCTVK